MGLSQFWEKIPNTELYAWRFAPNWQNCGDTPTKHLVIHSNGELRDTLLPLEFNFGYDTTETGNGLIPPRQTLVGGQASAGGKPGLTPQDILDVQNGTKFFYIWGWACYRDVFLNTKEHITRFCWMITSFGDPFTFKPESQNASEKVIFGYRYHPKDNCADEECG